jgi:hypothetical protein
LIDWLRIRSCDGFLIAVMNSSNCFDYLNDCQLLKEDLLLQIYLVSLLPYLPEFNVLMNITRAFIFKLEDEMQLFFFLQMLHKNILNTF